MGVCKPEGCFCPRCLALFNEYCGGSWTREELAHHLLDKTGGTQRKAAENPGKKKIFPFCRISRTPADGAAPSGGPVPEGDDGCQKKHCHPAAKREIGPWPDIFRADPLGNKGGSPEESGEKKKEKILL